MEQRFEARKREIEQDAKLDTKDLAGAAQRLDRFLAPYFDYLPRSETRQNASCLLFRSRIASRLPNGSCQYRLCLNKITDGFLQLCKIITWKRIVAIYFTGDFLEAIPHRNSEVGVNIKLAYPVFDSGSHLLVWSAGAAVQDQRDFTGGIQLFEQSNIQFR